MFEVTAIRFAVSSFQAAVAPEIFLPVRIDPRNVARVVSQYLGLIGELKRMSLPRVGRRMRKQAAPMKV